MITPAYALTATERVLPRMALDFTTGVLDSRVTVARLLNTATRVNSSGFVEVVNANLPRFDYDPVTLAPKGLLIEEARTNLLTYSEQFDNAVWTKTAATITANSTTSPGGTATADTLQATAGTGITPRVADASVLTVNGAAHTASMYVKAGTYTFFQIYLSSQSGEWANFTLTGAGSASANGASTATIQAVGNSWYRITMTYTAGGIDRRPFFMMAASASATRGQAWNPVGTETVFIWGAQLEVGAFATSYIPTTATSLTRNADVVSMTGTNFSSWYNASQGALSVVADSGNVPNADSTVRMAAAITDVISFTNAVRLERLSGQYRAVTTVAGAAALVTGTWGVNTVGTLVSAYGANAVAAFNGAAAQPFAQTAPISPLFLGIGSNGLDANFFCGHIKSIRYFPQRLLNAETQAFSK